jgi:dihydroorotase
MSSNLCLFIRHARILLPTGEFFIGDVETRAGEIVQVAPEIPASNATSVAREIDATGLTLLPGVIPTFRTLNCHTDGIGWWQSIIPGMAK